MSPNPFRHAGASLAAATLLGMSLFEPFEQRFNPHKTRRCEIQKQPHSRGPARQPKPRKGKSHNTRRSR